MKYNFNEKIILKKLEFRFSEVYLQRLKSV